MREVIQIMEQLYCAWITRM